jgi:teichuronic acid biosynthesis glycosyltransferase TuaC
MEFLLKILWTHNFDPNVKGAGVFMYGMVEAMKSEGVVVELYYMGKLTKLHDIIRSYFSIRSKSKEYDLVHAQYGSMCGLITALAAKKNKVLFIRGSDWYTPTNVSFMRRMHGKISTILTRLSLPFYRKITVVSKRIKKDIIAKTAVHPDVLNVLPSAINLNVFKPLDKWLCREQLGFGHDKSKWVLLTTLSRKNQIKRVWLAEEAIVIAQKKLGCDVVLKTATNIPHHEMPVLINACDAIILTSVYEGWPNCIKEALACNVPFVSTDVSDLKEIADAEASCHVVKSDSSLDLALALVACLQDSGEKHFGRHVYNMQLSAISLQLKKIYSNVIDQYN